jgi:hypothetical protein
MSGTGRERDFFRITSNYFNCRFSISSRAPIILQRDAKLSLDWIKREKRRMRKSHPNPSGSSPGEKPA